MKSLKILSDTQNSNLFQQGLFTAIALTASIKGIELGDKYLTGQTKNTVNLALATIFFCSGAVSLNYGFKVLNSESNS